MTQRYSPLTTISTALSLCLGLSTLTPKDAIAATFTYQENPAISNNIRAGVRTESGNTLTVNNAAVLTNTSNSATTDTVYIVPFIFSLVDGNVITLGWENTADAYVNSNYDGLGNSLNVAITNFAGRVRLGDVADLTGKAPFPLTIPCDSSPSCPPPAPLPLPVATQDASDKLPFFDLGTFAAGETKTLDLSLDFSYEDSRSGVLPILPTFSILSATTQSVPEPTVLIGLITVSGLAALRRNGTPRPSK